MFSMDRSRQSCKRLVCCGVSDLIFATKIRGTAEALGVDLQIMPTATGLLAVMATNPDLFIVDLNLDAQDPINLIRELRSQAPLIEIVAYVSHVQTELAALARLAGADRVLPRSQFTAELPTLLAGRAE